MVKRPGVEQNAGALALDESAVVRIRQALIFAARAAGRELSRFLCFLRRRRYAS